MMSEISAEVQNLLDLLDLYRKAALELHCGDGCNDDDNFRNYTIAGQNLKSFIASLAAEVAELRAYRDGYSPDEKMPMHGNKNISVDG